MKRDFQIVDGLPRDSVSLTIDVIITVLIKHTIFELLFTQKQKFSDNINRFIPGLQ